MSLKTISPEEAKQLIDQGAMLVDIRGADEHAQESIPGARNCPVGSLTTLEAASTPVVFFCRTGQRTGANAQRLSAAANCEAFVIEGGIDAWKRAGLPVRS